MGSKRQKLWQVLSFVFVEKVQKRAIPITGTHSLDKTQASELFDPFHPPAPYLMSHRQTESC